jgi:integrase
LNRRIAPGRGEALKEVKNKKERQIPLYQTVADIFASSPVRSLTPYVFVKGRSGNPYSKNINRDIWNPACRRAIGKLIPLNNACRHSLANQMLARGESLERVKQALGHSGIGVTAAYYGDERSAMDALRVAVDNVRRVK